MKLNAIEKAVMNNPVRSWAQRHYEAPLLIRLGGRLDGARVLEVGCGRGVGMEILVDRFGAGHVEGFDIDPDMVARARRRLRRHPADRMRVDVGDATSIAAADGTYDAVVDFGILHHVPDWRAAITEIHRVLLPGGRFYFEEVTSHALARPSYRLLFDHPRDDRFTACAFVEELEARGIAVGEHVVERVAGDFVIGVGWKARHQPADRSRAGGAVAV